MLFLCRQDAGLFCLLNLPPSCCGEKAKLLWLSRLGSTITTITTCRLPLIKVMFSRSFIPWVTLFSRDRQALARLNTVQRMTQDLHVDSADNIRKVRRIPMPFPHTKQYARLCHFFPFLSLCLLHTSPFAHVSDHEGFKRGIPTCVGRHWLCSVPTNTRGRH
jgi:hypothetical protein